MFILWVCWLCLRQQVFWKEQEKISSRCRSCIVSLLTPDLFVPSGLQTLDNFPLVILSHSVLLLKYACSGSPSVSWYFLTSFWGSALIWNSELCKFVLRCLWFNMFLYQTSGCLWRHILSYLCCIKPSCCFPPAPIRSIKDSADKIM